MRNRKSIVWLTLMIFALAAIHVFLSYRGADALRNDIASGISVWDAVFPPTAGSSDVETVVLERGDAPGVRLERQSSWSMTSPYRAIADEQAVNRFLDAFQIAPVEESMTDAELLKIGRTHADFGFDAPSLRITLGLSGKHPSVPVVLTFGNTTPSGAGVYAEIGDAAMVSVVGSNFFSRVNVGADDFRRRTLFRVGFESVTAFDIKQGLGAFLRFSKVGEGWSMVSPHEGPAADEAVRKILSDVMSASAVGFIWPLGGTNESGTASAALLSSYGLDPESAVTLTFKCVDGVDRQIAFGKEAGDGLVYALVQEGTAVVTVPIALKNGVIADPMRFSDLRVFPYAPSQITSLSLVDGESNYLLSRDGQGVWELESPVVAPADQRAVEGLLGRLLSLRSNALDAKGLRVSVSTNAESSCVSREAVLAGMRLEDLRAKEVVRIDPEAVKRIVVSDVKAGKTSSVVYDRERMAWNVETSSDSGVVSPKALAALLDALNPLGASRVVQLKVSAVDLRDYGLENPKFIVAIDQDRQDAIRKNVLIGDSVSEGRYVTVGSTDAVFVVPEATIRTLLKRIVED